MMKMQEQGFFEFDSFRLDVQQKLLLRDGQPVPLTPKAFETLLILVRNSGRVLEKEMMMKEVWPDTFVEEANLSNNISSLRKVLGEGGDNNVFIQTIPKRGYRFVSTVRAIGDPDAELVVEKHTVSSVVVEEGQPDSAGQRLLGSAPRTRFLDLIRHRSVLLLFLVILVVGLTAGIMLQQRLSKPSSPVFHQISFRRGVIWSARFAPDAQTIVYGAAWEGRPSALFTARSGTADSRALDLPDATVLSISKNGEMALLLKPRFLGTPIVGTLARLPLTGGEAPREILEEVQDADWSPDGKELAVVHWDAGVCRLEYPIKKTLYEARAPEWISDVRISPDGERIAFLDHPAERYDDRGSVMIIDRTGKKVLQSSVFTSAFGLSWSAAGDEVWFTASADDLNNSLHALSLNGRVRVIASGPGRLRLQDIARDGRVLITHEDIRNGLVALPPGETRERDLSWFDGSWFRDISADGRTLLFDEEGQAGGATAAVYLRKMDGSPAVRLGEGHAIALSPDGKWVLARQRFTTPPKLILFNSGAGDSKELQAGQITFHESGSWFADGKRLLLVGEEPGHGPRCYIYDLDSGQARPVTPEGITGELVSPEGKFVIAGAAGQKRALFPIDGGEPRPILGQEDTDEILRWGPDGQSIYVVQFRGLTAAIFRLDPVSGKREPLKEIAPSDSAGLLLFPSLGITADGKSYAYTYFRTFSDLFSVDGLK